MLDTIYGAGLKSGMLGFAILIVGFTLLFSYFIPGMLAETSKTATLIVSIICVFFGLGGSIAGFSM